MTAFDWRDYVILDLPDPYFDAEGKPTADFQSFTADQQKIIKANYDRQIENAGILVKTMDQISLIPEVQQKILKAHQVLEERIKGDPELAKESGGKTHITLSGLYITDYDAENAGVNINSKDFATSKFKSTQGDKVFSLQQALIHEFGHAGDPSLTSEKDLQQRKAALTQAVQTVLKYYPNLKDEYGKHRTLMGHPVDGAFNATNPQDFDKFYEDNTLKGRNITIPESDFAEMVKHSPLGSPNDQDVLGVLNSAYKRGLEKIVETQDEQPAINGANQVMPTYFGEPKRTAYESARVHHMPDFDAPPPSLATYTHSDIRVPPEMLAETKRCSRTALKNHACADMHIPDVHYADETPASVAPMDRAKISKRALKPAHKGHAP
jgi:hypothetical protein